ncbi:hypothetical protein [Aquimarina sp. I32.4]|uniref:hypothetical protein n=1 Tax=Aquimarina sp. I32.4 TaxID=2053903 RepID=UPI000CDF03E6|nr:hypothetical protein [Aquimarina sp. I32.4]
MKATPNIDITFYQNLGKLFYAIAAADKVVRVSEYDSLQKIVNSEWIKIENSYDEFGLDTSFQIEIVFDWLDHKQLSAEESFAQFETYFEENKSYFTPRIQQLIWNTANSIAGAFSGKNKSELMMLGRLKLLLEKSNI